MEVDERTAMLDGILDAIIDSLYEIDVETSIDYNEPAILEIFYDGSHIITLNIENSTVTALYVCDVMAVIQLADPEFISKIKNLVLKIIVEEKAEEAANESQDADILDNNEFQERWKVSK